MGLKRSAAVGRDRPRNNCSHFGVAVGLGAVGHGAVGLGAVGLAAVSLDVVRLWSGGDVFRIAHALVAAAARRAILLPPGLAHASLDGLILDGVLAHVAD